MNQACIIQFHDKEILVVDYSDCNGEQMIDVFEQAKAMVLDKPSQYSILSIMNEKTYISGKFMKHVENELPQVDQYIQKQAIIGLSSVQYWILKGLNLWYKRQVYPFNTKEEALKFLVS